LFRYPSLVILLLRVVPCIVVVVNIANHIIRTSEEFNVHYRVVSFVGKAYTIG
jgi:hypothetical protein